MFPRSHHTHASVVCSFLVYPPSCPRAYVHGHLLFQPLTTTITTALTGSSTSTIERPLEGSELDLAQFAGGDCLRFTVHWTRMLRHCITNPCPQSARSGTTTPLDMPAIKVTSSACSKCGTVKKSGKHSCCARGGAWFKKCGDVGDKNVDHTWAEGVQACKSNVERLTFVTAHYRGYRVMQSNCLANYHTWLVDVVFLAATTPFSTSYMLGLAI